MQLSNEQTLILIGKQAAQNEYLTYLLQGLQAENEKLKKEQAEETPDKKKPEKAEKSDA